jgi:hypothetical protein
VAEALADPWTWVFQDCLLAFHSNCTIYDIRILDKSEIINGSADGSKYEGIYLVLVHRVNIFGLCICRWLCFLVCERRFFFFLTLVTRFFIYIGSCIIRIWKLEGSLGCSSKGELYTLLKTFRVLVD